MAAELMQGWVTLSATIARVRLNTNISRNNLYILQAKRSTPLLKARQCLLLPTQGLPNLSEIVRHSEQSVFLTVV